MKLSHLTKDQKRARNNTMSWRRQAINLLEFDQYYLYQTAIQYIRDPNKKESLLFYADRMHNQTNKLKLINKELEKYESHNEI